MEIKEAFKQPDSSSGNTPSWQVDSYAENNHICLYFTRGSLIRSVTFIEEPTTMERRLGITMEKKLKRAIKKMQKRYKGYSAKITWDAVQNIGMSNWYEYKGDRDQDD